MAKRVAKKVDTKIEKNKVIQKNLFGEDIIEDEPISEVETKSVDLFKFTNMLFKDKETYEKMSLYERGKQSFMINRYMASTYPYQACMLSVNKINPGIITSVWYNNVFRNMTAPPQYFYIKISNKYKKTIEYKPSEEAISLFKEKYNLENKAYNEVFIRYKDDVLNELKDIEKMIKAK